MILVYLLDGIFKTVPASLDLIVYTGYFALEDITMSLSAVITTLFVTMCAWIDVGLFGADVASGHDGINTRIRKFAYLIIRVICACGYFH
jgi:hypothetical protein